MRKYRAGNTPRPSRRKFVLAAAAVVLVVFAAWFVFGRQSGDGQNGSSQIQFDASLTEAERQAIQDAASNPGPVQASAKTTLAADNANNLLAVYVPVTHKYAVRQNVNLDEIPGLAVHLPAGTDPIIKNALAEALDTAGDSFTDMPEEINHEAVAFMPIQQLSPEVKLLSLDNTYYLDSFLGGAVFRSAEFNGDGAAALRDTALNDFAGKDDTLKVNMTGVTALTRLMMRRLSSVGDAKFFSEKIGPVLSDADITHISNEVSFRESGCQYSNTSFCSPIEFIETLKASGVNLVELTGNHNNDNGHIYNTETIKLYHSLGMATFGGGLNREEAAKPHLADQKGSKLSFIGYNMADGLGSGAIAGDTTAGANFYTDEKARADIEAAKQSSQFVIVSIQYAECQAYPAGYVEYPICDKPIGGQEAAFRKMIDYGADMVVGSSAHQPQTFEFYNGKPIYYGLGNMYFDQTQWPGTERGIILSHYFAGGKLLQTRLLPTVYDRDYQPRLMTEDEALYLLDRLRSARG